MRDGIFSVIFLVSMHKPIYFIYSITSTQLYGGFLPAPVYLEQTTRAAADAGMQLLLLLLETPAAQ
jgi:hypothetical protein